MRDLVDQLLLAHDLGRNVVHCEVVETRGSTPQKPGSVMLVFENGDQAGTLGGGCTEAEVRRQALTQFDSLDPRLFVFTLDDNYGWDDGLICGGRMTFLAQPVRSDAGAGTPGVVDYFRRLQKLLHGGRGGTEAVVTDADKSGLTAGARFLFDENGTLMTTHLVHEAPESIIDRLIDIRERPRPYVQQGVAFIPILPRCRLLIVGAGHVGQAVAELAARVDFDVWVLDDRERYANIERFPMAERVWVEEIGRALASFEPDENTYCLIMTRGHSNDEEALFHLAGKPARYIGLIGSNRKIKLIFEDLEKDGVARKSLEQIHAPLGFDIGSQTVPEIAVSIVAHLVGHRNRGAAAFPPANVLTPGGGSIPPSVLPADYRAGSGRPSLQKPRGS